MSQPRGEDAAPADLLAASELCRDGRLDDAAALVEALAQARAEPFDTPFQDRVRLALTLADLFVATGQRERALSLLRVELAYTEHIDSLISQTGSPEQVRAARIGRCQVQDRAAQLSLVGRPAPEIEVAEWVLGRPTALAQEHGRVVLLEFWTPWCRPCLAMFAVLGELHARYRERGLTIIALTRFVGGGPASDPVADRDRQLDMISSAVAGRGLDIAVGIAPDGRLAQQYGMVGVPAVTLVDRAGNVALAPPASDKANLEKTVADLLNASA